MNLKENTSYFICSIFVIIVLFDKVSVLSVVQKKVFFPAKFAWLFLSVERVVLSSYHAVLENKNI